MRFSRALALLAALSTTVLGPACAPASEAEETTGDEQSVTGTAVANKDDLFGGEFYYVRINGWDGGKMTPSTLRDESRTGGAEVSIFKSDKKNDVHCPDAETSGSKLVYKTKAFTLRTSGNLTSGTPKSSYKISLEKKDDRLFKMKAINLKSMWNDASQMREALAWRLFREAGVDAPRHTYAKFCVNGKYFGLYSMIEQVEKPFLEDHFGANDKGNLYKAYWGKDDVGPADLTYKKAGDDDSGKQYKKNGNNDERSYQLKTNDEDEDDAAFKTYDDLATLARTLSGAATSGSGDSQFASAEYADAMEKVFNVKSFLRWAGVNVMIGAWDNYWATPANYYLYNAGSKDKPKKFMEAPYFVFIPWDYDNTFGADFFGTKWQYASITDWEGSTRSYHGGQRTSKLPLVTNLLKNQRFLRYYLDHIEWLNNTFFTEAWLTKSVGDEDKGLRSRVQTAAYLESDSPAGASHTGRQFSNDEVYKHGFAHEEFVRGGSRLEGLLHYVHMRHDNVKDQLADLRRAHPRGSSGAAFPARPEAIP